MVASRASSVTGIVLARPGLAALAVAMLALAGCPGLQQAPSLPGAVPPGAGTTPAATGVIRYALSGHESLLVVLAYRAGPLAALGHDHLIATRALTGFIDVAEPLIASAIELHLPVAEFTVDDPELRASHGHGLATVPPDAARKGTRDNMLGPDVLDAARFPEIVVRSVSLHGGPQDFTAGLDLQVRGVHRRIEVPVQVTGPAAGQLQVRARFPLSQVAIGLVPFSVMMGALQVGDQLAIEADLVARRK